MTNLMVDEPRVVVLEELLRPIPGGEPSGRSLQYDHIYDLIKEARRADDPNAPRDIWARDLKVADWREVRRLCETALVRDSKDLQICAWLAEAWFHLDGVRGLRRGVELVLQMSESYWETVHPSLSAGVEFRASPFVWMNEKLPAAVGQVHVVLPDGDPSEGVSWDAWKRALWLEKVSARRPQDAEVQKDIATSLSISDFKKLAGKTPEAFFRDNAAVLQDTISTIRTLEDFLDDRLGSGSPSLVRFREALAEVHTWTELMVREGAFRPDPQGSTQMDHDPSHESQADAASGRPAGLPRSAGAINSRADAYRALLAAAQYLKEVEPHSPTPYLVMKAVSWGDKSLDDLLREFVREGLNLEALFTFLGIEPRDGR